MSLENLVIMEQLVYTDLSLSDYWCVQAYLLLAPVYSLCWLSVVIALWKGQCSALRILGFLATLMVTLVPAHLLEFRCRFNIQYFNAHSWFRGLSLTHHVEMKAFATCRWSVLSTDVDMNFPLPTDLLGNAGCFQHLQVLLTCWLSCTSEGC
jgi:hypothetical protein